MHLKITIYLYFYFQEYARVNLHFFDEYLVHRLMNIQLWLLQHADAVTQRSLSCANFLHALSNFTLTFNNNTCGTRVINIPGILCLANPEIIEGKKSPQMFCKIFFVQVVAKTKYVHNNSNIYILLVHKLQLPYK